MKKKNIINIIAVIIILFSGILFYLKYQNYTIKKSAIETVKNATGLNMSIGNVEYAPFSKTAKLKDIKISNLQGFDYPSIIEIKQIRVNEINNSKNKISYNSFDINGLKMFLDSDAKNNHSLTYLYRSLKNDIVKNGPDINDKNIEIKTLNIRNITINPTQSTLKDMPEATRIKDIVLTNIGITQPIKMGYMVKITTVHTIEQSAFKIGQAKINHIVDNVKSKASQAGNLIIEQGKYVKEQGAIFGDRFKDDFGKFSNKFEKALKNQMETDPLGLKKLGLIKDKPPEDQQKMPITPKEIEEPNKPIIEAIPELDPAAPSSP